MFTGKTFEYCSLTASNSGRLSFTSVIITGNTQKSWSGRSAIQTAVNVHVQIHIDFKQINLHIKIWELLVGRKSIKEEEKRIEESGMGGM